MKSENPNSLINKTLLSIAMLFIVSCGGGNSTDGTSTDSSSSGTVTQSNSKDPTSSTSTDLEPVTVVKEAINIVNKIEVITHYGHLHGSSFHANAQPEGSPFLRKQVLVLEKSEDNTWKQVSLNGKEVSEKNNTFLLEGKNSEKDITDNLGGRYAFEFIYYNKEGERINAIFFNESSKYQTFFSIDSYTDNISKDKITLDDAGASIFYYRYRDTDPENQMYRRRGTAKLAHNNLGLKGYLALKKSRISFSLSVHLVKFKDTYTKKDSPIFKETKGADIIDAQITFNLPVNILTKHPVTDADSETRFKELGAYFGISSEKMEDLEWGDLDPESSQYWM